MALAEYTKDPQAVLDYEVDWSAWLDGDTIATSTWAVQTGITKDTDSHTTTRTLIRLSGGTARNNYELTNHIVTSAGLADDRTILIRVEEK